MNLWVLDFDGVLFDTANEAALMAYNAINDSSYLECDLLPSEYLKLFVANRFHVHTAGDFITLARWCLTHASNSDLVLSRAEFQTILKAEKAPIARRQSLFFSTRDKVSSIDSNLWCKLNCPYAPLWDWLKSLDKKLFNQIVILTNKDKPSVLRLCAYFGLDFNPDNIFGAQDSKTKMENFEIIRSRFGKTFGNAISYCVVDDSIANLLDIYATISKDEQLKTSLKLYLATWGYIGKEDVTRAKEYKFSVLIQAELIELLYRTEK